MADHQDDDDYVGGLDAQARLTTASWDRRIVPGRAMICCVRFYVGLPGTSACR